uniref:SecY n=1 Tax=Sebdenia flabellata TaxID=42024 RepID=A0A0E3DBM7_9FLOR|nr:SecY [Sebdenia flabellata]
MKINLLISFYSIEILIRLMYVFFSLILCLFIIVYNIHTLLLFETYPFLNLSNKKFIITHVTDLFDTTWTLISLSFLCILPIFCYQLFNFFKASWYNYQLRFSRKLFLLVSITMTVVSILSYFFLIPTILKFLTQWDKLNQINNFLFIETEFILLHYIFWVLSFQYNIMNITIIFSVLLSQIWLWYKLENIYWLMKFYRKQLTFLTLCILFILSPTDVFLQFVIISFTYLFYEIIFLVICYKLTNSN